MNHEDNDHKHTYTFKGVFYTVSPYSRPGSGAHTRSLVDVFFCTQCLIEEERNSRFFGTTYDETDGVLPR